jgi:6-pyruvoyltetrahydropterin/6-carboxytetrahydropterin synthase
MTERLLFSAAASFESARKVEILPTGHRSARLHGHSFLARVRCELPSAWGGLPGGETEQLVERLTRCVSEVDYDYLNNHLEVPTDENLARWINSRLEVPGIVLVGIQSTRHEGADLDLLGNAHIWRRYRFESAHQLPNVPEGHQCGRMHGHGFEVILHANQSIGSADMGVDYDYLDACWAPIHAELDHACLNDIPGLENPTSEMIATWIWNRLKHQLPQLSCVTVYETVTAGCHFDGVHYRIWKEMRFESALSLQRAHQGDRRRRLHGHSYLLRLHLTAPLDPVMGWTVDYGDVKEYFKPVYKRLDHHLLDELDGIEDSDVASLVHWIRKQVGDSLPQLDRIDLYQTPGCGAILAWGEQGPALPT